MRTSRCLYEGCGRERRYQIGYKLQSGQIEWIPVCGTHDKFIGRHNLIAWGWSLKDAIRFESNPDIVVHTNGHSSNGQWYGLESESFKSLWPSREAQNVRGV